MGEYCKKTGEDCYGVRELKLLFEISTLLNKVKRNLKSNLEPVIDLLADYLCAEKVILTILNRANNQISIEVAFGLTEEEQNRGNYKIGEGVIGKVVETGKPVVVSKISEHDGYPVCGSGDESAGDSSRIWTFERKRPFCGVV